MDQQPDPTPPTAPAGSAGSADRPLDRSGGGPLRIRASDSDRNVVIERLGDALAEGALDTVEYNRRLEAATTAVTQGDLAPLTADLPESQAARRRAEAARRAARAEADKREWFNEWGYWGGGALIMTVIWGIACLRDGELRFYWPVWPLGIWAAILVSYALWPERDKDDKSGRGSGAR
ncbi:DUF1707 SHOCT-like domain-containing protein [Actinomadura kijaniata]|uniref:DUF1707 SHOCT-like domain-containing protein n=1 Tax=Actinomadura kijaniata TaxID=46161 RepID=UPI001471A70D|nr:DUF1707 domain-containing protein [Actinomadura kijaniata]